MKREPCLWSPSSFLGSCIKLRPLIYVHVRVLWQLNLYLGLPPTVPGLASPPWLPGHVPGLNCHWGRGWQSQVCWLTLVTATSPAPACVLCNGLTVLELLPCPACLLQIQFLAPFSMHTSTGLLLPASEKLIWWIHGFVEHWIYFKTGYEIIFSISFWPWDWHKNDLYCTLKVSICQNSWQIFPDSPTILWHFCYIMS